MSGRYQRRPAQLNLLGIGQPGNTAAPGSIFHELLNNPHLPSELQSELNLARRYLQGSELPKPRLRVSATVERLQVVQWWREVGVVENIEELRSELNIEVFRDFGNFGVLNHGEVHIDQPRSYDGVAPQVAEKVDTRGEGETLITVRVVKVLVRGLGIDEACRIDVLEAAVAARCLGFAIVALRVA